MTPEDVGYCRTSLIFWCSLFGFIFYFSCYYFVSVFCRVFPLKLLFIGIVTFVNLGKTIPDFPNSGTRIAHVHEDSREKHCTLNIANGSLVSSYIMNFSTTKPLGGSYNSIDSSNGVVSISSNRRIANLIDAPCIWVTIYCVASLSSGTYRWFNSHYAGDWMVVLGANSPDHGMQVFEGLNLACGFSSFWGLLSSWLFELLELLLDRLEWDRLTCLRDPLLVMIG